MAEVALIVAELSLAAKGLPTLARKILTLDWNCYIYAPL